MLPETVSRSGCWVHVRREFIETGPTPRRVKGKAKQALEMINELFKIEKALKNTSLQERFAVRQAKSQPIVEHFFDWLNITNVVEKSALEKAVHYALGQQKLLTSFLNDAAISLTNNTAERHIKTAVIGRKNLPFSTSQNGAQTNALFLSIIETAKANGLNPRKYIEHLLNGIPQLAVPSDTEQLKVYLPWIE